MKRATRLPTDTHPKCAGSSSPCGGKINRRDLLRYSAMAGVGFWVAGRGGWSFGEEGKSPNERLNVACIGVGGKGNSDTDDVAKHANVVAICDIDENWLNVKGEKLPRAMKFTDYRKLFDAIVIPR